MSGTSDEFLRPLPGLAMDRRSLVMGVGLAAVGALYYLREPAASAKAVEQESFSSAIPGKVAGWTSRKSQEVVVPPQDDSNELYENIETRIYEGPGLPTMMLLIAFSSVQQNDIQVHRPEVCYPASGFPIIWTRATQIDLPSGSVSGRELLADRGGLQERILYWVRVGDTFPTSWARQRLTMAAQNLKGRIPDGALFRVSAIEEPDNSSMKAILSFVEAFLKEVPASFRDSVLL